MNIVVKARHMDVTDAIRRHMESKLSKLQRLYEGIQSIEAILDMEAAQSVVEIIVTARRKHTFVATHRHEDMYACADQCVDKIAQQIRRHKDRLRSRRAEPANHLQAEPPAC